MRRQYGRLLRVIASIVIVSVPVLGISHVGRVQTIAPASAGSAGQPSNVPVRMRVEPLVCGGGDGTLETGSGARDDAGRTYIACSRDADGGSASYILELGTDGTEEARITLPPGGPDGITDVAPSPDGSMLYVVGANTKRVHRLSRSGGAWTWDTHWRLAQFDLLLPWQPVGTFLAVSHAGDIYLAVGLGAPAPYTVAEYRPDGSFVTHFGIESKNSWRLGEFYGALAGIAVSEDGRYVYTTEAGNNNRIQRFARMDDGSYVADRSVGDHPHNDRKGHCGTLGLFNYPADVAIGPTGDVFAINTGCLTTGAGSSTVEVQRFSADLAPKQRLVAATPATNPVKGIAVDRLGRVVLAGAKIIATP